MLKKCLLAGSVVVILAGLAGAAGCTINRTPLAVVEGFYRAVDEGDLSRAEQFIGDVHFLEVAEPVAGYIQSVEILDEVVEPHPVILYGHEVQRAWITVNVTLSPGFKEPTDWDWYQELMFMTGPFPEGEHLLYLQKHDPEYRPEWNGEWIIRGSESPD